MGVTFSDPSTEIEDGRQPPAPSAPVDAPLEAIDPSDTADSQPAPTSDPERGDTSPSREDLIRRLSARQDTEAASVAPPETPDTPVVAATETATKTKDSPSEPDLSNEDPDFARFSEGSKKRIRALVAQRNEVRTKLSKYESEAKERADAGVAPEHWDAWAKMGMAIHRDPAGAAEKIAQMAERLGWKPPVVRETVDLSDTSVITKALEELEESNEITRSGVKSLRKVLREAIQAQPQPQPASQVPAKAEADDAYTRTAILTRLVSEGQATYQKDWAIISTEADARLKALGTIPTAALEKTTREIIRGVHLDHELKKAQQELTKLRNGAAPRPAVQTGLRPSSAAISTAPQGTREAGRAALLSRLS